MKQYNTHLEAKVAARNSVNRYAFTFCHAAFAALEPFVGQKILNQGNVKSAKLVAALPKFSNTPDLSVYFESTRWGISMNVNVCVSFPNARGEYCSACYAEQSVYLGDVEKFVLTKLSALPTGLRFDYTVEEIVQARKELNAARDAMRHAEHKVCHFGEHDNH
jgi:hypothetical protein